MVSRSAVSWQIWRQPWTKRAIDAIGSQHLDQMDGENFVECLARVCIQTLLVHILWIVVNECCCVSNASVVWVLPSEFLRGRCIVLTKIILFLHTESDCNFFVDIFNLLDNNNNKSMHAFANWIPKKCLSNNCLSCHNLNF